MQLLRKKFETMNVQTNFIRPWHITTMCTIMVCTKSIILIPQFTKSILKNNYCKHVLCSESSSTPAALDEPRAGEAKRSDYVNSTREGHLKPWSI